MYCSIGSECDGSVCAGGANAIGMVSGSDASGDVCCGAEGGFCGEYTHVMSGGVNVGVNNWVNAPSSDTDYIRLSEGCGIEVADGLGGSGQKRTYIGEATLCGDGWCDRMRSYRLFQLDCPAAIEREMPNLNRMEPHTDCDPHAMANGMQYGTQPFLASSRSTGDPNPDYYIGHWLQRCSNLNDDTFYLYRRRSGVYGSCDRPSPPCSIACIDGVWKPQNEDIRSGIVSDCQEVIGVQDLSPTWLQANCYPGGKKPWVMVNDPRGNRCIESGECSSTGGPFVRSQKECQRKAWQERGAYVYEYQPLTGECCIHRSIRSCSDYRTVAEPWRVFERPAYVDQPTVVPTLPTGTT